MTTRTTIRSGDSATLASPALIPMLLCCASGGIAGHTYTFNPGDDVSASIGGGIGADEAYALLRGTQGEIRVTLAEPTWGPLPSVSKSGSGPTVTVALADGALGPFDDFRIVFTVDRGGVGGQGASVTAAYDGSTVIETIQIPAPTPAVLRGTVDIAAFTYPYSGLSTKHLDFTAPSAATITFGAAYADPQAIVDDFNALAVAVPTAGSETSDVGSFPVALANGDTFVGKVDEQGSASTLTISATAALRTGSGATYAAVTAGHTLTLTLAGTQYVVTFTGSESTQAAFHNTINGTIFPSGFAANSGGQTRISTDIKGNGATGSIDAADSDVLASLGLSVSSFTAGTGNVANVAAVTAAAFAALLTSTFTGGTAGSTGTAIGTDRVKWETNTAGAAPKGVQFTSGSGVAKISGFDNLEHNGTAAADLAVRARLAEASDGSTYFELYSVDAGPSATVTIDPSASDADTVLGFTVGAGNLTATGADATLTPPWTGLTFTFPADSDYVAGTTYATPCQGPRASIGAIVDAATAAHDNYQDAPFGFLVVGQPSDTQANCAALESALSTLQATWLADPYNAVMVNFVVGSKFHVASSNVTTNNTNIQSNDAALLLAFQAASANFGNVAHDDVYVPGSTSLRFGSYRRTSAIDWAVKHGSAAKLAADVADGLVPEATLLGPDQRTRARNEATATTKLGGGSGPGFSVLRATSSGLGFVKFSPGATRAGPTSRLRFIGPLTVAFEIARLVYPLVELWEGQTIPADPITRQMSDAEKKNRQNQVYTLLSPVLLPADGAPNVTPLSDNKACNVQILNPLTGVFLDNGQVRIRIQFIPLGEIEEVFVDISATGAIVSQAA